MTIALLLPPYGFPHYDHLMEGVGHNKNKWVWNSDQLETGGYKGQQSYRDEGGIPDIIQHRSAPMCTSLSNHQSNLVKRIDLLQVIAGEMLSTMFTTCTCLLHDYLVISLIGKHPRFSSATTHYCIIIRMEYMYFITLDANSEIMRVCKWCKCIRLIILQHVGKHW